MNTNQDAKYLSILTRGSLIACFACLVFSTINMDYFYCSAVLFFFGYFVKKINSNYISFNYKKLIFSLVTLTTVIGLGFVPALWGHYVIYVHTGIDFGIPIIIAVYILSLFFIGKCLKKEENPVSTKIHTQFISDKQFYRYVIWWAIFALFNSILLIPFLFFLISTHPYVVFLIPNPYAFFPIIFLGLLYLLLFYNHHFCKNKTTTSKFMGILNAFNNKLQSDRLLRIYLYLGLFIYCVFPIFMVSLHLHLTYALCGKIDHTMIFILFSILFIQAYKLKKSRYYFFTFTVLIASLAMLSPRILASISNANFGLRMKIYFFLYDISHNIANNFLETPEINFAPILYRFFACSGLYFFCLLLFFLPVPKQEKRE